jgi:DNA-binding beta-propeller fold protein YncE
MKRLLLAAAMLCFAADAKPAQNTTYQLAENWAQLPGGTNWGPVAAVAVDSHGTIFAFRRNEPSVWQFDSTGKFQKSWGEKMFVWTHGFRVDRNGFLWATDGRGHQVFKFSPDGKVLLTLGKKDVGGDTPDTFNRPTDVVVAPNGDFFISDGYVNSRVVKFNKEGRFIKTWGTKGTGPGQFTLPHTIVMDSRGRLFVGDRENRRIQIFDQDGKFLDQWSQFGSPYGMFMTKDDVLYVADGTDKNQVTIGSAIDGKVNGTIENLNQPHWVTVDAAGAVYVAEVRGERLKKFVKK